MIRLLRAPLAAACLLLSLSCAHNSRPFPVVQREAWLEALRLSGEPADSQWRFSGTVLYTPAQVFSNPGERLFGQYTSKLTVAPNGDVQAVETVTVFLLPSEVPKLLQKVLQHEYLHALYGRKCLTDPKFQMLNPDNEAWVCGLLPCDD